jgi:hypothetical protein
VQKQERESAGGVRFARDDGEKQAEARTGDSGFVRCAQNDNSKKAKAKAKAKGKCKGKDKSKDEGKGKSKDEGKAGPGLKPVRRGTVQWAKAHC